MNDHSETAHTSRTDEPVVATVGDEAREAQQRAQAQQQEAQIQALATATRIAARAAEIAFEDAAPEIAKIEAFKILLGHLLEADRLRFMATLEAARAMPGGRPDRIVRPFGRPA